MFAHFLFETVLFFLCQKEENGFNLPRKERGLSKPEVHLVPPSRQKKPANMELSLPRQKRNAAGFF